MALSPFWRTSTLLTLFTPAICPDASKTALFLRWTSQGGRAPGPLLKPYQETRKALKGLGCPRLRRPPHPSLHTSRCPRIKPSPITDLPCHSISDVANTPETALCSHIQRPVTLNLHFCSNTGTLCLTYRLSWGANPIPACTKDVDLKQTWRNLGAILEPEPTTNPENTRPVGEDRLECQRGWGQGGG
jgi:hypothetical protein